MTPHYADDWLTIHGGDARDVLPTLPDASVHCVVTSPPYWGLRDYGTATWTGGREDCDHLAGPPASDKNTLNGGKGWTPTAYGMPFRGVCGRCGASREDAQLGLEATPEEYVANLVAVFREVRRVLRDDGTLWLNLGDSYASNGGDLNKRQPNASNTGQQRVIDANANKGGNRTPPDGLKAKDLVGIPWRVAFALQGDGWWLRSDIIWSKPNPMPESVTDRPTKAHEYLFLLAKRERYYFDQEAVREARDPKQIEWREKYGATVAAWGQRHETALGRNGHDGLARQENGPNRNLRSVWTIATRPYPGAHFAVFPPELPERCIKAGTSERGVCPQCGAPWRRVVEVSRGAMPAERGGKNYGAVQGTSPTSALRKVGGDDWYAYAGNSRTLSWIPSCAHDVEPVGASVLDPFAGSGTVGMVANRLSRRAILIDLNPEYLEQQMKRNAQVPLGV